MSESVESLIRDLKMARWEHRADVEAWRCRFDLLKKEKDQLEKTLNNMIPASHLPESVAESLEKQDTSHMKKFNNEI